MATTVDPLIFAAGVLAGAVAAAWVVQRLAKARRVVDVERALAEVRVDLAVAAERAEARQSEVQAARANLARLEADLESARQAASQASGEIARLKTLIEAEQRLSGEKLALLESAREVLGTQFKTLATEILEEKGRSLADQHRSQLDLLLKPLGERLQEFGKKVDDVYVAEAKERHSLADEVRKLQAANIQISQEALNLTRALKGDAKTRGNWGEVILERVLERSGLERGREYVTQFSVQGPDGELRPDVVVRLPEGHHVVIDAKVSLVAYDRYYAAEDDVQRAAALREHLQSMREHVRSLSDKGYAALPGINAPDFVAMFVPIEPAFNLAAANDESLYLDAFEKKVIIVTPGTLLAMMSVARALWQRERQNRHATEIAERAGLLYKKFDVLVRTLLEVGDKLDAARKAFDLAMGSLSEGRGNLIRNVEELKRLGAKTDRALPPELLAAAGMADEPAGDPLSADDTARLP